MTTGLHYHDIGVPPGLLADSGLRLERRLVLPGRERTADRLSGRLVPDWQHAHLVRLPGRAFLIIPAIFAPTANNGQGTMGTTGTTRTLSSYAVGAGAVMLIAGVHVWHNTTTRAINSVTFNGTGMSAGQTVTFTGDGHHRSTIYYQASPSITTADIVATFDASGSGQASGVCACWVAGISTSAPEAGQSGSGLASGSGATMTAAITTLTDGALVIAFSGFWSGAAVDVGGEATQLFQTADVGGNGHFCALGYAVAGSAGSHTLGWLHGSDPSWSLAVNSFAAAGGGGGGATVLPSARRRSSLICR